MAGKHALKTPEAKDRKVDPTATTRVLKHPATAPAAVTAVAVTLVMGLGWLNQANEVGPASLATPLAEGGTGTDGGRTDAGRTDDGHAQGREPDIGEPVLATRGRRAVLVPTWMDLPLVTPALAMRPDAIAMLIPGAEPTTMPPASGSGTGSGNPGGSGGGTATTATSRPGSGTSTPGTGTAGPTVTTGPGPTPTGGDTTTTETPDTTTTTETPDTTTTTDSPETTPTTQQTTTTEAEVPPATVPPPTGAPPSEPPANEPPGGLLDVVDDLLDALAPVLEPLPLL